MTGEDRLIDWLRRRLRRSGADLLGDDAAVLPAPLPEVVTVDQQIAGVHFPPDLDPAAVARRLVAVALSDLAAMGAQPGYAFLALGLPPGSDPRRLFAALVAACQAAGLTLAGGDVARSDRLTAALTLTGRRYPGGRLVRRGDARCGDRLWAGGTLGESAVGRRLVERGARLRGGGATLPPEFRSPSSQRRVAARAVRRHLAPRAQIELGRWLAGRRRAAAIDVSDGLTLDLARLCREGGVGARLDAARIPLAGGIEPLARRLGAEPLQLALSGGEDYVLLFALPPGVRPPHHLGARRIGEITRRDLVLADRGGSHPLPAAGWDHLAKR